MADDHLTHYEMQVVQLIAKGLTRWAIAEQLGSAESDVRRVIRRLCAEYDCNMRDLPDCVKGDKP